MHDYASRVVNGARAGIVRALLFVAGSLPFISWSLSSVNSSRALVRFLDRWFQVQCHGRLERSIALAGQFFPVCSRCLGIYAGLALAAVVARPKLPQRIRRAWLLAAAAFMVGEVVVQERTGHAPIHALRLLTGLLLAYPVALIVIDGTQATPALTPASQPPP